MARLVAPPPISRLVTSTVAMPDARRRPTVEDLLRVYPPDPDLRAPGRPGTFLYQANQADAQSSLIEEAGPLDVSRSPLSDRLDRWRKAARASLLSEARGWSSAYRDELPPDSFESATLLLSGHQPEFFHPGVWFKNFVLSEEARTSARPVVPINVLIDYDLCAKRGVAHPAVVDGGARLETLSVDREASPVAYERASIVDRAFVAEFPRRLAEFRRRFWPRGSSCPIARRLFDDSPDLLANAASFGDFAAQARHRYEATIGLSTLEVPFRKLAVESSFLEFIDLLLRDAKSFRAHYDAAIRAVRRVQKLRSKTHPAPELIERDGWIETPFWIWTKDDPTRRRLFARTMAGEVELSDLANSRWSIGGEDQAIERLAALAGQGVAVRPRALVATLWMRMVLGDVFVHGIGGAKYDQAADLLMTSYFGVAPPAYLVATATFNLTDRAPGDAASKARESKGRLRDLEQHPERHLSADAGEPERRAAEEIRIALAERRIDAAVHRRLRAARDVLREASSDRSEQARRDVAALETHLRAERLLDARDRSLLLFDDQTLPRRLHEAARTAVVARKSSAS